MKAIVCVKQVPDTQGKVAVKADGTMDRSAMATITNPDDLNAVEAALQLKDETGCEVVVVTMGPPPAEGMLRELMARGADRGVLVSGREFGGSDTFATSQILAAAVNKIGVGPEDIVFCGRQAIDGDTAQVGPQIAEKLHLPQVTYVTDIQKDGNSLTVKRQLEDGYMELKVQTPCLLTCIKELNTPRYMSVSGIFECYDKPLEVFDYNALKDDPLIETDTIGLKGSPTNVYKVVHGLPVPVADPSVLHIVEVVEVCGIAADHAPQAHIRVALRVKEGLFLQFRHAILLMTSSFRRPRPQGPCCGHSKWS